MPVAVKFRKKRGSGFLVLLFGLFIIATVLQVLVLNKKLQQVWALQASANEGQSQPQPLASASYVTLDGLTLVIVFDRPVNMSAFIESVEQRRASADSTANEGTPSDDSEQAASVRHHAQQVALFKFKLNKKGNATTPKKISKPQSDLRAAQSLAASASSNFQRRRAATAGGSAQRVCRRGGAQRDEANDDDDEANEVDERPPLETALPLEGVQICAQLFARKTLRVLRKYRLHNCYWASQVQLLVQLNKPINQSQLPIRVTFARNSIIGSAQTATVQGQQQQPQPQGAARELSVELGKLPLESLGVPLAPRLALVGPNQVPVCGRFALSALLSSPFGTQADDSVRLSWSVERIGVAPPANETFGGGPQPPDGSNSGGSDLSSTTPVTATNQQRQRAGGGAASASSEQRWRALKQFVARQRGNNLLLEAHQLELAPQLYEFRLSAQFTTSLSRVTLNASHQLGRLDFDAPIGTIYGSHQLALETSADSAPGHQQQVARVNPSRHLLLLADLQVPECAQNVKQVGLYWQVSDPRVRFEQTYAPYYLARPQTLPEQAMLEFRLNLFYGIRVKKFATSGVFVPTGDSILEAQISDGLLVASVGQPPVVSGGRVNYNNNGPDQSFGGGGGGGGHFELYAGTATTTPMAVTGAPTTAQTSGGGKVGVDNNDHYAYQWSCFDAKTAQPCSKSLRLQASSNGTRYEFGSSATSAQNPAVLAAATRPLDNQQAGSGGPQNGLLLVDRTRQRQQTLQLPLAWLDSDAQLWFGLQRFDRNNPSLQSRTEYALVSVHEQHERQEALVVSIGPVLLGRARQRAHIRNPLTGAMVLVANAPVVIVGRLGPLATADASSQPAFWWQMPNYVHPLHWTWRNATNAHTGQPEVYTELHLNPELLVAHGHYQVQLVACEGGGGASNAIATLSLDVVQGVSQCRVELITAIRATGGSQQPLVVGVNYCNIPLGLAPLTYQLYLIDTTESDSLIASSRLPPTGGATSAQQQQASPQPQQLQDDDYVNEADEVSFESQAQPISVPQLSAVFILSGLNAISLAALLQAPLSLQRQPQQPPPVVAGQRADASVRVRFGARVCDRLQACRMFYSSSIDPMNLLAAANAAAAANPAGNTDQPPAIIDASSPSAARGSNQSAALALRQVGEISNGSANGPQVEQEQKQQQQQQERQVATHSQAIGTLRAMLEAAKRANTAGNSIAAVSILNGVITLGQRMLSSGNVNGGGATATPVARRQRRPVAAQTATPPIGQSAPTSGHNQMPADQNRLNLNGADTENRQPERWEAGAAREKLATAAAAVEDEREQRDLSELRELVHAAMRDCLQYGAQSVQRQFHYTESGQTNLMLSALSKIIATTAATTTTSGSSLVELKYRALKLMQAIVRRSIEQSVNLKSNCLADFKAIQSAFESLFGTFSQHSVAATAAGAQSAETSRHHLRHHDNNNNSNKRHSQQGGSRSSSRDKADAGRLILPNENVAQEAEHERHLINGKSHQLGDYPSQRSASSKSFPPPALSIASGDIEAAAAAATTTIASSSQFQWPASAGNLLVSPGASSTSASVSVSARSRDRRKREEAILAFLRAIRAAHRALLQSAALQLALGDVRQFEYQTSFESSTTPPSLPAEIVSSLTHQTELPRQPIEIELREFGTATLEFAAPLKLAAKLARHLASSQLRCRNDTTTRCASLVLALTSFAGKAPFRSLDWQPLPSELQGAKPVELPPVHSHHQAHLLRVPVIQVDWLSPVDGSNLIELLREDERVSGGDGDSLRVRDFEATVTFVVPAELASESANNSTTGGATSGYKCYQFDEQLNEWAPVEQAQRGRAETANETEVAPGGSRRISCTFGGFGALAVFRGAPPTGERSTELSIALAVLALMTFVGLISLLGCCASKSRAKRHNHNHRRRRRRNASSSNSSSLSESDPSKNCYVSSTDSGESSSDVAANQFNQQQQQQQHRSALSDYPLPQRL